MSENAPLLLIDSYAQIFRCYYAVRALSTRDGVPTNAIFGMLKFLLKLEEKYASSDGAFVFDHGRPPHRMALAPEYKANRAPTPEDLKAQLDTIRALVDAFGWHVVEAPDSEADDLIGSITEHFAERPVTIVSADKDLCQLINDRVEMMVPDPAGKGLARRGIAEVREKFGVDPSQIVDYLALIGDSSDNIPGLPGVGPKTAAALLNQFGSIENILANTAAISRESLRAKFEGAQDLLNVNIQLVKLLTIPPDGITWQPADFKRRTLDIDRIRAIAESCQLRSLLKEIDALAVTRACSCRKMEEKTAPEVKNEPAASVPEQLTLF